MTQYNTVCAQNVPETGENMTGSPITRCFTDDSQRKSHNANDLGKLNGGFFPELRCNISDFVSLKTILDAVIGYVNEIFASLFPKLHCKSISFQSYAANHSGQAQGFHNLLSWV